MERERLTITLRKDILRLVDQSIDGAKLRNRSHAIEYYLTQQLASKTAHVAVLLYSPERPSYQAGNMQIGINKQMVSTRSLQPIFANLAAQKFSDLTVIGTQDSSLAAAVVDAEKIGLQAKTLELSDEYSSLDMAINQLMEQFKDEQFIVWDSRFTGDINLYELLEYHNLAKGLVTAALGNGSNIGMFGQLYGQRIISVNDSSQKDAMPFAGVMVVEPGLANYTNGKKSFYKEILPKLAREGKLSGFAFVSTAVALQTQKEAVQR